MQDAGAPAAGEFRPRFAVPAGVPRTGAISGGCPGRLGAARSWRLAPARHGTAGSDGAPRRAIGASYPRGRNGPKRGDMSRESDNARARVGRAGGRWLSVRPGVG